MIESVYVYPVYLAYGGVSKTGKWVIDNAIKNEDYYSIFSAKMHSGKSYIGSKNTLGGLLLFLNAAIKKKQKITAAKLGKVIDQIAHLSAWKAIEMQQPICAQKEIEKIWQCIPGG